jgi:hypothetical protein
MAENGHDPPVEDMGTHDRPRIYPAIQVEIRLVQLDP